MLILFFYFWKHQILLRKILSLYFFILKTSIHQNMILGAVNAISYVIYNRWHIFLRGRLYWLLIIQNYLFVFFLLRYGEIVTIWWVEAFKILSMWAFFIAYIALLDILALPYYLILAFIFKQIIVRVINSFRLGIWIFGMRSLMIWVL